MVVERRRSEGEEVGCLRGGIKGGRLSVGFPAVPVGYLLRVFRRCCLLDTLRCCILMD